MKRLLPTVCLACAWLVYFAEPCWSHGGGHYPPPPPRPPPPVAGLPSGPPVGGGGPTGPSGPSGATPAGPGPAGVPGRATTPQPRPPLPPLPITGAPDEFSPALWQTWWSYNHDAFLDVRAILQGRTATSDENPLVAQRRALQAALTPVLARALQLGDKDVVLRQVLIAYARLTPVAGQRDVLDRFARLHLGLENPNMKEAALLALGLGGDPVVSTALLRSVLIDAASARTLLASESGIPFRVRAFAAYALGLIGEREDGEATRRGVAHALLHVLGQEAAVEREIRVACALALGLVPIAGCASRNEALDTLDAIHLCGGVQASFLLAIAQNKEQDPWFRGHAAASLGRLAALAGDGFPGTRDHIAIRSRTELVQALCQLLKDAEDPPVVHGCLLGLANVCDADADSVDAQARAQLAETVKRSEPMAQRFALIALATALARPGTGDQPDVAWQEGADLMRELGRAKGARVPWSALALAVAGHGRAMGRNSFPASFPAALREHLANARDADEAAAAALALAILRQEDAAASEALQKAFAKLALPAFRAHGAFALGLLGVSEAKPALEAALDAPKAPLAEVLATSIGLRLLGDPDVVPDLAKRLAAAKAKREEALTIVRTLALLQDPAAGQPLLDLLQDAELHEDVRAAIVWCLGSLADPESRDWTASYANGIDYNFMPWSLRSPLGDGRGVLDWR